MNERREPTISTAPIKAERSRVHEVRPERSHDETAKIRERVTATGYDTGASPRPEVIVEKRSGLGITGILVGLTALGFSGYIFWQSQLTRDELIITKAKLSQAEVRVSDLEKKLSSADDESTQNIMVLGATVKENSSEIRKLWGVSYDRNRKNIAELEAQVKSIKDGLAGGNKKVETELNKLAKTVASYNTEMALLTDLQEAQQSALNTIDTKNKQHALKIEKFASQIEGLEDALRNRVANNEEAIASIDAFRRQVNQEILKLKQWTQATW